eukprot:1175769-Prorocentrum_minimum.AAC.5
MANHQICGVAASVKAPHLVWTSGCVRVVTGVQVIFAGVCPHHHVCIVLIIYQCMCLVPPFVPPGLF